MTYEIDSFIYNDNLKQIGLYDIVKHPSLTDYEIFSNGKATSSAINHKKDDVINNIIKYVNPPKKMSLPFSHNAKKNHIKVSCDDNSYLITPMMMTKIAEVITRSLAHGVKKNDILNIISNTIVDGDVTGEESALYRDTDGTLKTININKVSDFIFNTVKEKLVSEKDIAQDSSIAEVKREVDEHIEDVNKVDVWDDFTTE